MGALRKAGVWLGLVEDEEDGYDEADETDETYQDRGRYEGSSRYSSRYDRQRLGPDRGPVERQLDDDGFDDEPDEPAPEPVRPRLVERPEPAERASVRTLNRTSVTSLTQDRPSAQDGPTTQDNLALAPQLQLGDRAVASDADPRYRITTVHPTTYSEARTIGEHFRNNTPVIMNLSEMDEAGAMRLVDFAAGLIFGLRGTIERVTNRVFLLSPANVTVTAEDKAKIAEGGFFNQS